MNQTVFLAQALAVGFWATTVALILGWLVWGVLNHEVFQKIRFQRIFGHWPTTNPHLKKLMQTQVVNRRMEELAGELFRHNREEASYLHKMKDGLVPFSEAEKLLPRTRAAALAHYKRFKQARVAADVCGFGTLSYKEYVGSSSEEPPELPFEGINDQVLMP